MLDMGANCVAIVRHPAPDYMGFKYLFSSHIKMSSTPLLTREQRREPKKQVESYIARLAEEDQLKAKELIKQSKLGAYWFQPEFKSTKQLLKLAAVDIYPMYELLSGASHGGWSGQVLFNDSPTIQDINPRPHPRGSVQAIRLSSRLLLEVGYTRDLWERSGTLDEGQRLVRENASFPSVAMK
jgi:hypothetical protein